MHRTAARVDQNQAEIVRALRMIPGVSVITGMDDLLIGHHGLTYWVELKSSETVSKKTGRVLNSRKRKTQKRLEREWRGHFAICVTLDDVLREMGLL